MLIKIKKSDLSSIKNQIPCMIKVNSYEEFKACQEVLFTLGCKWRYQDGNQMLIKCYATPCYILVSQHVPMELTYSSIHGLGSKCSRYTPIEIQSLRPVVFENMPFDFDGATFTHPYVTDICLDFIEEMDKTVRKLDAHGYILNTFKLTGKAGSFHIEFDAKDIAQFINYAREYNQFYN